MKHLIEPGKISVLVGGQWGSEGKGAVAGWMARREGTHFDFAATNAGAQSGHTTVIKAEGRRLICYHLPTIGVLQNIPVYLTAGSIIDVDLLFEEWHLTDFPIGLLYIHPMAAIIEPEDKAKARDPASANAKIASTQKGVGPALVRKIGRAGNVAGNNHRFIGGLCNDPDALLDRLTSGEAGILEVPQGFGLGLNHGGCYPHCTSRDCNVSSAMADAGLHPSYLHHVTMVVRTYPIRVGNIAEVKDSDSGPALSDQIETTFEDIGVSPEFTTVTKRKRRVFTFSMKQYARALRYNRPDVVVLTFCNYFHNANDLIALDTDMQLAEYAMVGRRVDRFYQYGPDVTEITDSREKVIDLIEVQNG